VYRRLPPEQGRSNSRWLARALQAAIREYRQVWMHAPGRLVPATGLSRYYENGLGASHLLARTHTDTHTHRHTARA
jgi:neutral trehalase